MVTRHRSVVQRFADGDRARLIKLFRQLGTDNPHEFEAARGMIDSLLRRFDKHWRDLIPLLGGTLTRIHADLAGYIAALGSTNPEERASGRRKLDDLLSRQRKSWNDLVDELFSVSPAGWVSGSASDDPPRVNPLQLVDHLLREYVVLRESHEYIAVALWALHTHVYDRFMVTPRLALRSPVPACGKSTLLDILAKLTARADKFDSITTAAICRLIDETHPTLLIDEADNLGLVLQPNGKLRAVFNSGHRNGGTTALLDRGRMRRFSTFAPLALALPDIVSGLPPTLNSRCITITMQRIDGQRELRRFEASHPDPALDAAYSQILLWRSELEQLNPDPEISAGMHGRFADNWRPLLSIADALGWGIEAREAMIKFAGEYQNADVKIHLLGDIRKVFDANAIDRLPTKTLLDALHALDDADWNEFRGVRGEQQPHKLKDSELAAMLREFRIMPRSVWPPAARTANSRSAKGYRRLQFEQVWRQYCTDDGTSAQSSNVKNLRRADDGTA